MAQPPITDCLDCPCILQQAEAMAQQKMYDKAIRLFNAYKVCAPEKTAQTDQRIVEVFNLIDKQRIEAIAARREADRQKQNAIKALDKAERARRQAFANINAIKIEGIRKEDPTLALRMAEANYHLFPEWEITVKSFHEIYKTKNVFKIPNEEFLKD
jgi:hypothetical protein